MFTFLFAPALLFRLPLHLVAVHLAALPVGPEMLHLVVQGTELFLQGLLALLLAALE